MTEERRQAAGVERRILHAGAEELSERGIVGFKLRRVADRAGVAPATIYRYHNDRGELLLRAGRYLHEQEAQPLIAFAERDAARVQTVAEASAAIAVRTRDLLDPAMSTLCWRIAEFVALAPAEYVAGGQTTTSPLLNASCQMFTHVSQLTPFREGASCCLTTSESTPLRMTRLLKCWARLSERSSTPHLAAFRPPVQWRPLEQCSRTPRRVQLLVVRRSSDVRRTCLEQTS